MTTAAKLRAIILLATVALAGCGAPQDSRRAALASNGISPFGAVVTPASGPGVMRLRLRPFTSAGDVKSLDVTLQSISHTVSRPRATIVAATVDFAAAQQGDAGAIGRIAAQVARTTYCRSGALNIAEQHNGPSGGYAGAMVKFRCATPNPYMSQAQRTAARDPGPAATEFRARVIGKTSLSVSRQHGTQIEYLAPDGTAYLWYPGNGRVNTGRWQIRNAAPPKQYSEICFSYGARSYNRATGQIGSTSCTPAAVFLNRTADEVSGDPFNLRSGAIPFVLSRADRFTTISAVQAQQQ